jgi:16S rRNA processing protein RimM
MKDESEFVVVGRFGASYGVKGWVKVFPDTERSGGILSYDPWYIESEQGWEPIQRTEGRNHNKIVVAHIKGYDAKETVAALTSRQIAVKRSQLPKLSNTEFYWIELQGMNVVNLEGTALGCVDHLFEAGAGGILVAKGETEHLIPFVWDRFVKDVNRETGTITVDWDPDF